MFTGLVEALGSVTELVDDGRLAGLIDESGRDAVVEWIRGSLEEVRNWLVSRDETESDESRESLGERVIAGVLRSSERAGLRRFDPVVNATGVVLHTGLGRSPLSANARKAVDELGGAGNVEVDLETGERRYRGHQLQAAWRALCGAEDSVVVNNNAAATLLTLQALCAGREVVISRGQLIEIGGSSVPPVNWSLASYGTVEYVFNGAELVPRTTIVSFGASTTMTANSRSAPADE